MSAWRMSAQPTPRAAAFVRNFFWLIIHHVADIGIHKNRIHSCQNAVHLYGVAAILEIQVSANIVYHDEILVDSKAQVSDGVMET